MARELINELTWSVSRDSRFRDCQRAYYYTYYGSWGGWKNSAPERVRMLYRLKNIKSMAMWAGSIVHEVIAESMRRYSLKKMPVRVGELQAHARQKLRSGWLDAVRREWLKAPKKTNLHELYYGNGKSLPREQTEQAKAKIYDALRGFAESEILSEILSVSYLNWKPIDELDSFFLEDNLKVWCAVDFAFIDPRGSLRIIDWKTGSERAEEVKMQLACYMLYASLRWHVPLETQRVHAVFLSENARDSEYHIEAQDLVDAKGRILDSAAEMRSRLQDVAGNIASEDDFPVCNNVRKCYRCNYLQACPAAPADVGSAASATAFAQV